jgi:hypothetical protein
MSARIFKDEIMRAVLGPDAAGAKPADPVKLDALAGRLMEATTAYSTLRHKGYGSADTGLAATASAVPTASNPLRFLDLWASR